MKKVVCGIAGILATISAANAVDTAQIKAACQASDKMLWVERNQVCIPKNPCKNSNFEQYCNRKYKNVQLQGHGGTWRMKESADYKLLVEAYAKGHNLSCVPLDTDPKALGQDYVICMGEDVMVFEFDDISNAGATNWDAESSYEANKQYTKEYNGLVCEAFGGGYSTEDDVCKGIGSTECTELEGILRKYGIIWRDMDQAAYMNADTYVYWEEGKGCKMR